MKDKLIQFSLYSVGILASLILFLVSVKYILPVLMPFIIAWLIASFSNSKTESLSKNRRLPERATRLIFSLLFVLIVLSALGVILWQIISAVRSVVLDLGEGGELKEMLSSLTSPGLPFFGDGLPEEISGRISQMLSDLLTSILSGIAEGATSLVTALPKTFLFIVVTIIALVYFSLDYDRISKFIRLLLPEKMVNTASRLSRGILRVIGRYIRSYSLILLITYLTLLVGFLLLSVDRAMTIALLVALLDILPIIGVGTVLIPWGAIEIAMGNKLLGIGLLILFVVNTVIRQFSEPKIVGKSLDLHPVITLILLYVGYALFGVIGLILLPVLAVSVGVVLKDDGSAEIS